MFKKIYRLNFVKISHVLTNIPGLNSTRKSGIVIMGIFDILIAITHVTHYYSLLKNTREHISP